jgi:hypothetical protein
MGLLDTTVNALAIGAGASGVLHAGTNGAGVFDIEAVPPACVGDCDDSGDVRINEVVTLVNIGLESALPSVCPSGVPIGEPVGIALIVLAVNNGLDGCELATP